MTNTTQIAPLPKQYAVVDAPGHYGDYTKIYSAHKTLEAAQKAQRARGVSTCVIEHYGRKGARVHRLDAVACSVQP